MRFLGAMVGVKMSVGAGRGGVVYEARQGSLEVTKMNELCASLFQMNRETNECPKTQSFCLIFEPARECVNQVESNTQLNRKTTNPIR